MGDGDALRPRSRCGDLAIALADQERRFASAGWAFAIGAVVFSGSLYAMALGAPRMLGAITPIGGVSFLAGWALIIWRGLQQRA